MPATATPDPGAVVTRTRELIDLADQVQHLAFEREVLREEFRGVHLLPDHSGPEGVTRAASAARTTDWRRRACALSLMVNRVRTELLRLHPASVVDWPDWWATVGALCGSLTDGIRVGSAGIDLASWADGMSPLIQCLRDVITRLESTRPPSGPSDDPDDYRDHGRAGNEWLVAPYCQRKYGFTAPELSKHEKARATRRKWPRVRGWAYRWTVIWEMVDGKEKQKTDGGKRRAS
jgi:hypothetical protein